MKEMLMDDAEKESAWFSVCGYQETMVLIKRLLYDRV